MLLGFLSRIVRHRGGSSVVETAIIMPTLLGLMAGASDLAMGFYVKLQTQQAAVRSIEMANVGGLERLSVTDLQTEAAAAAKVTADKVTVTRWLECDGVTQPIFDSACNSGQVVGRYVSVRVNNSYRPILGPLLPARLSQDGTIQFSGFSSLRLQ